MLSKLLNRHKPRKFNYIPRHYDKENQNLIYNRIGDARFAQSYVQKKKIKSNTSLENEKRIDFTSYRTRQKHSKRSPQLNVVLILVGLMLLLLVFWLITNPDFTNIFAE